MGRIVVTEFVTVDGVFEDPAGWVRNRDRDGEIAEDAVGLFREIESGRGFRARDRWGRVHRYPPRWSRSQRVLGCMSVRTPAGENGTAGPFRDKPVSLPVMTATGQADARRSCGATR